MAALLHQLRREGQAAQERAEAAIALSTEQGFRNWLAMGLILRGWALAEQGQGEEGIAQMRQGLAALRAIGAELVTAVFSCPAGRGVWERGTGRGRATVLAEALAMVDKTGERFYEAELYRLKGELTLAQSSVQSLKSKVKSQSQKSKSYQSPTPDPRPPSRSRSVLSQSHRDCPEAASEVAGTARDDEPGATVATARQDSAEARPDVIRDLQLVHRRI